jgi:hypothetical protein
MKALILLVIFALAGLVLGYGIFAKAGNEYIAPARIFSGSTATGVSGFIDSVGDRMLDIEGRRQKILITGAAGGAVGLLLGAITSKRTKNIG